MSVVRDAFAALGVERRPWLDDEVVREAYHARVKTDHPDVAGAEGDDFAEINAAYATLRSPAKRLRHWLEQEGVPMGQFFPDAATMVFFSEIAGALQRWRELRETAERAEGRVAAAMARSIWMKEKPALERLGLAISEREAAAVCEVREWDVASDDVKTLAVLAGEMAFLSRWKVTIDAALAESL